MTLNYFCIFFSVLQVTKACHCSTQLPPFLSVICYYFSGHRSQVIKSSYLVHLFFCLPSGLLPSGFQFKMRLFLCHLICIRVSSSLLFSCKCYIISSEKFFVLITQSYFVLSCMIIFLGSKNTPEKFTF